MTPAQISPVVVAGVADREPRRVRLHRPYAATI